ncbi:MAG: hypothetical protein ACFFCL_08365 [Promethearchaeota archaeon]
MSSSKFYDIVNMDGIRISIPQSSHFSIGTSPYYAHQHGLAIDIYPNLTLENIEILSPVSGKIQQIKKLRAPQANFSEGIDTDYLILLSNPLNSEVLWKIMHVNPNVNIGDKIEVGDLLGKTLRNGYFAYWSSPHLHLEIRPNNDAIRARGGKSFSLALGKKYILKEYSKEINTNKIPIKIHSIYPEIILAYLPKHFYHNIFHFYGVKALVNNIECFLDGGIPHYKIGTVIFQKKYNSNNLYPVYIGRQMIGTLHEINGQFGFFKFNNIKFFLNNKEIRGVSLYLANSFPLIKIIPYNKNEFSFIPKSTQYLSIIPDKHLK